MKNIRKIQRQIVWKPPHVVTSLCLHLTNADARYLEQLSVKSGLYGIQFINALKHIPKWDLHPFKVIGFFLHHLKTSENLEFSVVEKEEKCGNKICLSLTWEWGQFGHLFQTYVLFSSLLILPASSLRIEIKLTLLFSHFFVVSQRPS